MITSYPLGSLLLKNFKKTQVLWRMWRGIVRHHWECNLVQPFRKTIWWVLRKLNLELPRDPAIPLLGIRPEILKGGTWREICAACSEQNLFTFVKRWKPPSLAERNGGAQRIVDSALKRKDMLTQAAGRMNLVDIMVNKTVRKQQTLYDPA